MAINVRLLDHTSDPIRSLYVAYRTAHSALTPSPFLAASPPSASEAPPAPSTRDES